MDFLKLILIGLIPAASAVLLYFLFRKTKLKNLNYWVQQIIVGIVFGGICILSTEVGTSFQGAVLNIRTASVAAGSFVFGWPAGLIASAIGSFERGISVLWNSARGYTEIACTVATAVAGIVCGSLRKFMFDDKIPSPIAGTMVVLVIESFHILMVFITNMNDLTTAFVFVENVTLKIIICNCLSILITLIAIYLICWKKEKGIIQDLSGKKIASSVQRNLFIAVIATFCMTVVFTFFIENNLTKSSAKDEIACNVEDLQGDVKMRADNIYSILAETMAERVIDDDMPGLNKQGTIPSDPSTDPELNNLHTYVTNLCTTYGVAEFNLVNDKGIIYASNLDYCSFDMASTPETKSLNELIQAKFPTACIQQFRKNAMPPYNYMKYAAYTLFKDNVNIGYIQIGYDEASFYNSLNAIIKDFTTYRQIGTTGRIMIAMKDQTIVSDWQRTYVDKKLSDKEVFNMDITQLNADNLNKHNIETTSNYFCFTEVEGYIIVGTKTESEVNMSRDMMLYVISLSEVIVFAILLIFIYMVINSLVVKRIQRINGRLSEITSGSLDVVVDVEDNKEFKSLSDDINKMVNSLKDNIEKEKQRNNRELSFARNIQLSSLPVPLDTTKGIDLYPLMATAKEVGGDFYDFYRIDKTHIALLIADVSGKGVPAAMFMMKAKTVIKSMVNKGMRAGEALTAANTELFNENEAGMFVTVWLGILDITNGELGFANAGHNPPAIGNQASHNFHFIKQKTGLVLGAMDNVTYPEQSLTLEKCQTIFLYTDGVTEATNNDNQLFGEERLLNSLNTYNCITNRHFVNCVKRDVDKFVGDAPQFDDITILAATYQGKKDMTKIDVKSTKKELPRIVDFIYENIQANDAQIVEKAMISFSDLLNDISTVVYPDNPGHIVVIATNDNGVVLNVVYDGPSNNIIAGKNDELFKKSRYYYEHNYNVIEIKL